MSRGLGHLQRDILATLDTAKEAATTATGPYRGYGGEARSTPWRWNRPGWVRYWGHCVQLASDVYDLAASSKYLARQSRALGYAKETLPAFSAAFSRAVKGLVQRDRLTPLWLVPLLDVDEHAPQHDRIEYQADGLYLLVMNRQCRFVIRSENREKYILT